MRKAEPEEACPEQGALEEAGSNFVSFADKAGVREEKDEA